MSEYHQENRLSPETQAHICTQLAEAAGMIAQQIAEQGITAIEDIEFEDLPIDTQNVINYVVTNAYIPREEDLEGEGLHPNGKCIKSGLTIGLAIGYTILLDEDDREDYITTFANNLNTLFNDGCDPRNTLNSGVDLSMVLEKTGANVLQFITRPEVDDALFIAFVDPEDMQTPDDYANKLYASALGYAIAGAYSILVTNAIYNQQPLDEEAHFDLLSDMALLEGMENHADVFDKDGFISASALFPDLFPETSE